ncbi:MAG: di-trans,poly-cis-decaprenylcistransferase [Candidatus Portnoybacteria bacterium RIFCSPLOWO2_12_FULL_39_9]|uniref:Isoprenyl transferase n=1 Tax=Candidatus Portnoybacteria bacterium RIFCSPHIGHO2_12_FULL_38_9 TaxID=1801997 RepID=A0A1G2FDX9_9BACT|nr:MAG: di-trans,poly-cis-decaprenylcistransferase [Candidatus Portnoybacteria bacterium RIFCSPHIGHO2_12_FULL_38_9]OGZ36942.1 MAG: di-trans,poly-cis-decaprenylcistransferase [Candidatus Portnoybacteria bacterium RIFCSPHIGHO2_02_FULL_39_12]OGZ37990.1 MAG: di-trans,poly-cis-decaprenylcistransferase [Candidatus Portnoybacteria bacterium RIFCSPLOWO2_01_FULL_38_39]OGZ40071.1 MAG: di-trans,poly-cis-decaprenylcistransferase [Candidatus Portnoybacteria bacterium RIFCSPLOWO2_12_FULL_39_9]
MEKIKNLPQHIAVIPDGNRRWAKKQGFNSWLGHRQGVESLEKVLKAAFDLGIPYFSFWGSSLDNITKRSRPEVKFLLNLFAKKFTELAKAKDIHQNKVQINVFGRWQELFPKRVSGAIEKAIEATKNYRQYRLNFFLAYNGTDEMLETVRQIVKIAKKQNPLEIGPELLKSHLWTKDLPPIDLIIRTGSQGDPHNSAGFMMWDSADSQLHFSQTLWPDFTRKEFTEIIKGYSQREKRFGA